MSVAAIISEGMGCVRQSEVNSEAERVEESEKKRPMSVAAIAPHQKWN